MRGRRAGRLCGEPGDLLARPRLVEPRGECLAREREHRGGAEMIAGAVAQERTDGNRQLVGGEPRVRALHVVEGRPPAEQLEDAELLLGATQWDAQ